MNAIELGGNAARTGMVGTTSCRSFTNPDRSVTLLILNPDGSLHCQEPEQPGASRSARLELAAPLALSQQFKQFIAQVLHLAIDTLNVDRLELHISESHVDN